MPSSERQRKSLSPIALRRCLTGDGEGGVGPGSTSSVGWQRDGGEVPAGRSESPFLTGSAALDLMSEGGHRRGAVWGGYVGSTSPPAKLRLLSSYS